MGPAGAGGITVVAFTIFAKRSGVAVPVHVGDLPAEDAREGSAVGSAVLAQYENAHPDSNMARRGPHARPRRMDPPRAALPHRRLRMW